MASNSGVFRSKRQQVIRACDWCRVHRIRCDNEQPCHNCRSRGGQCTVKGATEIRSLPHAYREIECLQRRVLELEKVIEARDRASVTPSRPPEATSVPVPVPAPAPAPAFVTSVTIDIDQNRKIGCHGANDHGPSQIQSAPWGLYTSNGQTPQRQWFGPSSLFYFINRMTSHLANLLERPPTQDPICFSPESSLFVPDDPSGLDPSQAPDQQLHHPQAAAGGTYLAAMQEQYFLGFFWQSHHCSLQIIDEAGFRELYKSLWANSKTRKPSALVDIILALCIQYDAGDTNYMSMTSRLHYHRCQALLVPQLEHPTISTLQCHIFSVIYLCCASLQNMAHSTLALAVRTAHILGLHMEPPQYLPLPEQEVRKRLWWTLYALEIKTCMKLGRPWSAPFSEPTCSLPSDDHHLAIHSGYACLADGNVTWLTYTVQNVKLVLSARNIYMDFYNECTSVLDVANNPLVYEDPVILERFAIFLKSRMSCIESWAKNVPDALKNKRKENGEPFSTDGTDIAIEVLFVPLWLQRQRLFLELLYHNLCMNLYRPLISFCSSSSAPVAQECAAACVSHAITLTQMTHMALTKTDLLRGWHEAFQWQWNAAITMIGFTLAYPFAPLSPAARTAIGLAIQVFDVFGRHFTVGIRAAKVARDLTAKAEIVLRHLQSDHVNGLPSDNAAWYVNGNSNPNEIGGDAALLIQEAGLDGARLQDVVTGTMDVAFSVDSSYNAFEMLNPHSLNFTDGWAFTSD